MKKLLFFILFSANLWAQEEIKITHKQEIKQPTNYGKGFSIYNMLGKPVVRTTETNSEWYLSEGVYNIIFYYEYEVKTERIIVKFENELDTTEITYKEFKIIIKEKI